MDMRVRLVIEMDTTIMDHKNITDRITEAALKTLKRRGGHLVGVYHEPVPVPPEEGFFRISGDWG